jgi:hypothetical protein
MAPGRLGTRKNEKGRAIRWIARPSEVNARTD